MTLSTQRTLFNTDLHLAMLFGKTYATLPHTTLNEKFKVSNSGTVNKMSIYPTLQYLCIGTGGNPGINSSAGFIHSEHSPIDAALFNHIPFAMYENGINDMDETRRSNYRFRVIEANENDGKEYICYYLRVLDNLDSAYDNKFQTIKNVGTETFISTFDTNIDLINPKPRTRKLDYSLVSETEFITKLCKIKVTFDAKEVEDLYKVYKLKGFKSNVLTEMGLCSGIETKDSTTGETTEPVSVQVMFFLDLSLDLTTNFNTKQSFTKYIEVGGAEPIIQGNVTSKAD